MSDRRYLTGCIKILVEYQVADIAGDPIKID